MPAEWEPHRGTILTWPQKNGCSFPPPYDAGVHETYARLIASLSENEEVHINAWDEDEVEYIDHLLRNASGCRRDNVFIHVHPSYEPWVRDHGPIFVKNTGSTASAVVATDWIYNAWGDKYPPYDLDNRIPSLIADKLHLESIKINMVLEGGSVEVNGCGDLLTTESCLLNPNRNPAMDKKSIEASLQSVLGIDRVLWLESGIEGDDTDGHIDDLTRFINPTTLVTATEKNHDDTNYEILEKNLQQLKGFRDINGNPYQVVEIPMPSPVIRDGERLPASYANFYIANDLVILPVFDVPEDQEAIDILSQCFPERRIVPINSLPLIWGLGSFHCLTQQIPN